MNRRECLSVFAAVAGAVVGQRGARAQGKQADGEIVDLIPLYAPYPAIQHKLLVENPTRLFKFSQGQ